MASPSTLATRLRYGLSKMSYSAAVSLKRYEAGEIRIGEFAGCLWNNFFQGKLTSMHWAGSMGSAMAPIIPSNGAAIVIRELPCSNPMRVFVGDDVVIRHAEEPSKVLIRRVAAIEGDKMISTDEKDEPFVLVNNQCWVLEDDPSLTPKTAKDSRLFGPVPLSYICGRVIYSLRTSVDHGPMENSCRAMERDSPILAMELNLEALVNGANMHLRK